MQEQQNSFIRSPSPGSEPASPRPSLEQRAILEARFMKKTAAIKAEVPAPLLAIGPHPLSFAQESLWFLDQFAPNSSLYNIPHVLRLTGELRLDWLSQAIQLIVGRHESLRTRIVLLNEKPVQEIVESVYFEVPIVDLRDMTVAERATETERRTSQESQRPFDLSRGPLFRASFLKLADREHILMLTMHHIISDLLSFQVFYQELTTAYAAIAQGVSPNLQPLKLQFPEYAAGQRRRMEGPAYQEQLEYWKKSLGGEIPLLELPVDRPRPANLSFAGRRQKIEMPLAILNGVKQVSRASNTTLFVTLMAAFQTLLHRYSNQNDIIVGSPMSERARIESEQLIGLLINTLPFRANFEENPTFTEVLDRVKQSVYGALTHQEAPVEKLIDDLKIPRNGARNPLFQTVFQFVSDSAPALRLPGVQIDSQEIELGTSKFDLTVTLAETLNGLVGDIEYSTELFDQSTITRIVSHFQTLLGSIAAQPHAKVKQLNILPLEERDLVVTKWNQTSSEYPRNATIPQIFEEQCARTPNAVAVVFEGKHLSYSELNRRSNQLGKRLQKLGVGANTMVGFCVERSLEMVLGLVGILKAGGAYVTLDPTLPRERLAYMFEDTKSPVFVTMQKFKSLAPEGSKVVCLDDTEHFANEDGNNFNRTITAENLAYVIYTSGSTGKPKGVLVSHRAVVRLVKGTNYLPFSTSDVFLQFANISFDASTLELWGPLLNGGKLVVFPAHFDSLGQLGTVIRENKATTLWLTAGLFHEMVENHLQDLKSVRYLLAGGDVLSASHVAKALRELPDTTIINGYGPTENTTFTCCYTLPGTWDGKRSVPIGMPISNTQVYVLDELNQPVPIGVPGELFVGGDGLASQYLNASELTLEKFVLNTISADGSRLYRTGDRVRWLANGCIEFLGRFDNQVKIRGFRIELSEVETALLEDPAIQNCVVTAREDSSKTRQLISYVVFRPGIARTVSELREFLSRKLPAYMVPSAFVPLDALPLNGSGKVDRKKLQQPSDLPDFKSENAVPPRNPMEQKIAEIWAEVLGIKHPGIHDNFFEIGGHSLLATRVMSRVNSAFNRDLPLRNLFESPTIGGLATAIAEGELSATPTIPMLKRRRSSEKAPSIQGETE